MPEELETDSINRCCAIAPFSTTDSSPLLNDNFKSTTEWRRCVLDNHTGDTAHLVEGPNGQYYAVAHDSAVIKYQDRT